MGSFPQIIGPPHQAYNGYIDGASHTACPQYPHPPGYLLPSEVAAKAARLGINASCTNASVIKRHLQPTTDLWDTLEPARGVNGTAFEEQILTNRVVDIMASHNTSVPLFIYYAMHLLHSPLCAPLDALARFAHIDNEDRRFVAAMTSLVDKAVGEVATEGRAVLMR